MKDFRESEYNVDEAVHREANMQHCCELAIVCQSKYTGNIFLTQRTLEQVMGERPFLLLVNTDCALKRRPSNMPSGDSLAMMKIACG